MRFVIEGVWHGRRNDMVAHRRVLTKRQADAQGGITSIQFGDGTLMSVTVRPATFREKVIEIRGYDSLISDLVRAKMTGRCSVDALIAHQKKQAEDRNSGVPA